MPDPAPLWTVAELATYLRCSPRTVAETLKLHPERLPPRVMAWQRRPLWDEQAVRAWAAQQSTVPSAYFPRRLGRPRKLPQLVG